MFKQQLYGRAYVWFFIGKSFYIYYCDFIIRFDKLLEQKYEQRQQQKKRESK